MKKHVCLAICVVLLLTLLAGCTVAHKHTYSNQWSFSETHHWHRATCDHTEEYRDYEAHDFQDGKCSVCGYEQGSEPSPYPDPKPNEFEFGDDISAQNDKFYEDYSDEEKQLYYTLWKEDTTVKVEIDISSHELQKLNEAYEYWRDNNKNATYADVYRKCNLTITVNGTQYNYDDVGIRMRGNTSRTDFVNENGEIYNLVHFRFNLGETFDGEDYEGNAWASELYYDWHRDTADGEAARKARKDRTFATMEKFYYKWNKCYDQTYIREVYANRMFQAYGILAPHITLSQICIKQHNNMESVGVGNLYELIDKQFIKRNFDKDHKGGDLYKCTYGSAGAADLTYIDGNNCGVETATKGYSYDLKTNDDPNEPEWSDHKYIKAFVNMLKSDKNAADFSSKLESMMDMDYFTRFEAVNYLVGNPDCIRNHANNYYLYFTPEDADGNFKVYIIPYDYDRCFGVNVEWNPEHSMVKASPYTTYGTEMECRNPLYLKTILDGGLSKYRAMYTDALNTVLSGKWFTYDNYKALYNAYKTNYANLARPSQLIIDQCSGKLNINAFVFSEDGSQNIDGGDNLSVSYYMQRKRATAANGLDK